MWDAGLEVILICLVGSSGLQFDHYPHAGYYTNRSWGILRHWELRIGYCSIVIDSSYLSFCLSYCQIQQLKTRPMVLPGLYFLLRVPKSFSLFNLFVCSSIISLQDWVGQTSGECALFDHKCDKNWQAGSLCTQVSYWLILLVSKS